MRWLLSLIFVMVTLSSASATETKTEFITEEVCHAVAGCWVNVKTGECPECVTETRKIVTVVENREFKGVSRLYLQNFMISRFFQENSRSGNAQISIFMKIPDREMLQILIFMKIPDFGIQFSRFLRNRWIFTIFTKFAKSLMNLLILLGKSTMMMIPMNALLEL